jgi:hypothetical protein
MKKLVRHLVIISLFVFTSESILSQTLKWSSSPRDNNYQRVGWLILKNNPLELRFWQYDQITKQLLIMDGALSNTPSVNITLSGDEGWGLYSEVGLVDYEPNLDFNGDGFNDLITSSSYPPPSQRYGLRIIDFTNAQTLFQLDDAAYSYGLINAFDYDNDGKLELAISKRNLNTNLSEVQVYSTNGSVSSVSQNINKIPNIYQLNQNYPNPFNPSTKIEFHISNQENIKIKIFDINGRLIRNILDENRNAGNYSIEWNGKNDAGELVSSGTYFYQLQAGDFVQTKKLIYLK